MIAKMGQDGHDRWRKSHRQQDLADAGFDVESGPLFSDPEEVAAQAIENDVTIVGASSWLAGP